MKAPINRILPYSFVDGPGNRAAVFVQGCNIHCLYCHNPETQNLCRNCGACVETCPVSALSLVNGKVRWNKEVCVRCDTCIRVCSHRASPKVEVMEAKEVMAEIRKSYPYIRGITVSGGECSLYPEFLKELFTYAKQDGLTTLMDSNGTTDFSGYPKLMEVSDGVMLDVKSWKDETYEKLTGGRNDIVKSNLVYLAKTGKLEEVRIVTLPDYVDAFEVVDGIAETLGAEMIEDLLLKLIRFRRFGVRGELKDHASPDSDYMSKLEEHAKEKGFQNTVIL